MALLRGRGVGESGARDAGSPVCRDEVPAAPLRELGLSEERVGGKQPADLAKIKPQTRARVLLGFATRRYL